MGKLTYLNHLKACAEAAKSFTNGLVDYPVLGKDDPLYKKEG